MNYCYNYPLLSEDLNSTGNVNQLTAISQDNTQNADTAKYQKMIFRIDNDNVSDIDGQIEEYLKDIYPIISDKAVQEIIASKFINKFLIDDSLGIVDIYANFWVPKWYLEDKANILWELNIPAFESHIFQIYNNDTILIDTWPNVVGKPSTKTYTGYYQAFRLRNWPSWKDPEAGDSVAATPPGPGNPLGLFVVHYDENSLRYFHGTNKNYLLKNEQRALSHGCVRNDNGNIEKMKQFIVKRVIKSDDLSNWLGSKKSMIYEIKDEDRFPVRIKYKTFDIKSDEYGAYIIFYKDVYNYSGRSKISKFDEASLITFSTIENILEDYKIKHFSNLIPDEKIIPIIQNLLSTYKYNEKYYFDELIAVQNSN